MTEMEVFLAITIGLPVFLFLALIVVLHVYLLNR